MWECSAAALAQRFEAPGWGMRIPQGDPGAIAKFREGDASTRRRHWINGHQVGQINGLQRREPFSILANDPVPDSLPGLRLAFPALFDAEVRPQDQVTAAAPAVWVGGDVLRRAISESPAVKSLVFYDFGGQALEPFEHPGVLHCPCLAIEGAVVAMSMPDPPLPAADSEPQAGRKARSWGKLLPGWYPVAAENGRLRVHGPAAPAEGLELPDGCSLDAEGFLISA
jgi:hypothetical protein